MKKTKVHPYIPNSVPEVKQEMLHQINASSVDDLYEDVPQSLRLPQPLNLPAPFLDELSLRRHVETILSKNQTTKEFISFLGAGCYQHYVPSICDEINQRSEFLTAYAGEPYDDHGRFQALWEYTSMMGELLNMDVVNVPTYDGFQAAATSLRMACRITKRKQVILPKTISKDKLSKIRDYLKPDITIRLCNYLPHNGSLDIQALKSILSKDVASIYFENPSYLGIIEDQGDEISSLAHQFGALCVVYVDPNSLGILTPPVDYGADIVCGDIQGLGMHMNFGGGQAGFIATQDDETFIQEYPSRLFGIAPTIVEGEYGFGDVAYERTSFARREEGKEWVGTAAALWGITAGVYLALMGPQGMRELGENILARCRYAMIRLAEIPSIKLPFLSQAHFKEFVVDFNSTGKSISQINQALLKFQIFGGKDLSAEFPELGQCALFCVTEVHSQENIEALVDALKEIVR